VTQVKQAGMLSPIDALRRVLEVLTLGPCGPLLVKHSARLLRALKAVDWTQLKANANRAQVRRGDARAAASGGRTAYNQSPRVRLVTAADARVLPVLGP